MVYSKISQCLLDIVQDILSNFQLGNNELNTYFPAIIETNPLDR
jgi:hypothetical protein